ncbi:odorant receptor 13a-like [Ceratina calcarata]|uniref:Odorant receptor n=1 Tax=Ceratina calcarata TaxID=156304 RepID=A0AAJ7S4E3_9HYME|nr:odorant receptor 13a-like [Ceratina calcarata]
MDFVTFEKRYLRATKRFSHWAGIWPDQNKCGKCIAWILIYLEMVSITVVQIARIVHFKNMDVFLDNLTLLSADITLFIKHGNYILNATEFKWLLKGMYQDWTVNRSDHEIAIMTKYVKRGALLTMFYLANAVVCTILFLQVPWTVRLIAKLKSYNTTPMIYIVPSYYFVDEADIFYFAQVHGSLAIITVLIVYGACDTIFTIIVQHACGLLAVAGYRFKHIEPGSINATTNSEEQITRTEKVHFSIQAHQRAIKYVEEIENVHATYLFLCMGLVVCCFTVTLVQVVSMEVSVEFYKECSFLFVQLMHLFYLTIQGQFVENVCENLHINIYEGLWYNANAKTQLLYVLALRRMLKPIRLTAGGLLNMNMQSFSEVIKASVSYYTVLR